MSEQLSQYIYTVGENARAASRVIGAASSADKSAALRRIADAVDESRQAICAANAKDMEGAKQQQIDQPLVDRLFFLKIITEQ